MERDEERGRRLREKVESGAPEQLLFFSLSLSLSLHTGWGGVSWRKGARSRAARTDVRRRTVNGDGGEKVEKVENERRRRFSFSRFHAGRDPGTRTLSSPHTIMLAALRSSARRSALVAASARAPASSLASVEADARPGGGGFFANLFSGGGGPGGVPLTEPLPGAPIVVPSPAPAAPPATQSSTLPNGAIVAAEDTPVSE